MASFFGIKSSDYMNVLLGIDKNPELESQIQSVKKRFEESYATRESPDSADSDNFEAEEDDTETDEKTSKPTKVVCSEAPRKFGKSIVRFPRRRFAINEEHVMHQNRDSFDTCYYQRPFPKSFSDNGNDGRYGSASAILQKMFPNVNSEKPWREFPAYTMNEELKIARISKKHALILNNLQEICDLLYRDYREENESTNSRKLICNYVDNIDCFETLVKLGLIEFLNCEKREGLKSLVKEREAILIAFTNKNYRNTATSDVITISPVFRENPKNWTIVTPLCFSYWDEAEWKYVEMSAERIKFYDEDTTKLEKWKLMSHQLFLVEQVHQITCLLKFIVPESVKCWQIKQLLYIVKRHSTGIELGVGFRQEDVEELNRIRKSRGAVHPDQVAKFFDFSDLPNTRLVQKDWVNEAQLIFDDDF
ncbi:unnamed protein product [Caenorhabditis bovis]|uniref:Uncharacterized protein n=1 Tax=Caenorhabditis bovis TaxID=2654633 RepID=A0A8S1EPV5_9PELO|nr:unnamed protein product [Caenorhabditis bovis]